MQEAVLSPSRTQKTGRGLRFLKIGVISISLATILTGLGIGLEKAHSHSIKNQIAERSNISVEQVDNYVKLFPDRYGDFGLWCVSSLWKLNKLSVTPERLKKIREQGIESYFFTQLPDLAYNFKKNYGDLNFWSRYEKLTSEGIPPRRALFLILSGASIKRAIEWKNVDPRLEDLVFMDISLSESERLVLEKEIKEGTVRDYLFIGARPYLIDTIIEADIPPEKVREGYGQLDWSDREQHREWLLAGLKDSDMQFCVEHGYPMKKAKRWTQKGLTPQEMHRQKTIYGLLTE